MEKMESREGMQDVIADSPSKQESQPKMDEAPDPEEDDLDDLDGAKLWLTSVF